MRISEAHTTLLADNATRAAFQPKLDKLRDELFTKIVRAVEPQRDSKRGSHAH